VAERVSSSLVEVAENLLEELNWKGQLEAVKSYQHHLELSPGLALELSHLQAESAAALPSDSKQDCSER